MSAAPKKGLYGEIKPRKAEFTLSEVNVPSPVAGRAESPEPVPSEPLATTRESGMGFARQHHCPHPLQQIAKSAPLPSGHLAGVPVNIVLALASCVQGKTIGLPRSDSLLTRFLGCDLYNMPLRASYHALADRIRSRCPGY